MLEADDDNALGNREGKPGRQKVLFVPSPPLSPPPSAPPLHSHIHPFILIPLIYPCVFSSLFSSYSSPSFASFSSVHSSTKKYDYKFMRNIMMLPHTNTVDLLLTNPLVALKVVTLHGA